VYAVADCGSQCDLAHDSSQQPTSSAFAGVDGAILVASLLVGVLIVFAVIRRVLLRRTTKEIKEEEVPLAELDATHEVRDSDWEAGQLQQASPHPPDSTV